MGFNLGHLRSQKFAAFIFAVFVGFVTGFVFPHDTFSTFVMGVVALYTAFVGGRAFQDGQTLKYGGAQVDPAPAKPAVTTVKKAIVTPPKENKDEVD